MRELNVTGYRCKFKRKSKLQIAPDELKREEDKNKKLSTKVRILEEQVKSLKQHINTRTFNPQKGNVFVPSPNIVWKSEQFENL